MNLAGTPADILIHSDDCPFNTTLWYLSVKKLEITFNIFPPTPLHFSLYIKPSCQTLSKALLMSKKTPRTS